MHTNGCAGRPDAPPLCSGFRCGRRQAEADAAAVSGSIWVSCRPPHPSQLGRRPLSPGGIVGNRAVAFDALHPHFFSHYATKHAARLVYISDASLVSFTICVFYGHTGRFLSAFRPICPSSVLRGFLNLVIFYPTSF